MIEIRPRNFIHRGRLLIKVKAFRKQGYRAIICAEKNWDNLLRKISFEWKQLDILDIAI